MKIFFITLLSIFITVIGYTQSYLSNDIIITYNSINNPAGSSAFAGSVGTMTDCDNNEYKTITIGSQVWMAENLRVAHYCDGTKIPNVIKDKKWRNLSEGACCDYDGDEIYDKIFGKLYNWYAVNDNRKICPKGWHVPSDKDWDVLVNYLGGSGVAGGKMKEAKTKHWDDTNIGATNLSGFRGLPGGYRYAYGNCDFMDANAYWWTSTKFDGLSAWNRGLDKTNKGVFRRNCDKKRRLQRQMHNGLELNVISNTTFIMTIL